MTVRSTIRELGWTDGLLFLLGQAMQRATAGRVRLVKYYLFAQPLGQPGRRPLRPDPVTRLLEVPATHPLAATFPRPTHVIQRRFASGAECTAALVRDEFAGFVWIQRDRYEEDEVRCTYLLQAPETSVWDYDVYVEPRFRVGRTLARLWEQVDLKLSREGIRWSFSRISAFNAPSLAAHARLGAVRVGQATFLCIGSWQLARLPHGWHGSLDDRRVPLLPLRPPVESVAE